MKKIKIILTGILFVLLANTAIAKINTKDKGIEIVVPFAPGGAATNVAHFVAAAFKEQGLETIVTNKPGNNTIIAANYAAKSQPTGHTIFIGTTSSQAANVAFKAEGMEYTDASFTPIVLLNQAGLALIVKEDGPIKTYEDLKSYVKKNPKEFNIGFYNANTANVFKDWARRENLPEPNIVLYKGSAQSVADVAGGTLTMAFDNFGWGAPMLPLIEARKLRVIATLDNSATKETAKIKNPVVDIAKIHPDVRFSVWIGLFAPAGTPKDVITEMNQIINKAVANTKNKEQVELMDGIGGTPEQLDELVKRDLRTLKKFADLK
jgi:tripartite-type tricarboxylate transporter receptor subunit TctC